MNDDEKQPQGRPRTKRTEYALTTTSQVYGTSGGKNYEPVVPPKVPDNDSQIEWEQVDMAAHNGSVNILWRRLVPIK